MADIVNRLRINQARKIDEHLDEVASLALLTERLGHNHPETVKQRQKVNALRTVIEGLYETIRLSH